MTNHGATGRPSRTLHGVLLALALLGAGLPPAARAVNVDDYPTLQLLVDEMASKYQFDRDTLIGWLSEVKLRDDVVETISRPRENLAWHEYRKSFVNDDRIREGAKFWKSNEEAVFRASGDFGVPAEIIVAILGVETRYGRQHGRFRVLDSLVTLMLHYPERAAFFRGELIEFLLLARELDVSPLAIKGSYAGAMGAPQFIASSYRRYAVDFDGNQRRDLSDIEDAIGSVANFLKQHGWQRGEPIVGDAEVEGSMYTWLENNGPEPRISLKHLARYGIVPVTRTDDHTLAALIALQGENGPIHRLGYNNFYVLTRYNRSTNYSMAVVELADAIRKQFYDQLTESTP
jgi:membrane-bound lytic murein transglycosylase B